MIATPASLILPWCRPILALAAGVLLSAGGPGIQRAFGSEAASNAAPAPAAAPASAPGPTPTAAPIRAGNPATPPLAGQAPALPSPAVTRPAPAGSSANASVSEATALFPVAQPPACELPLCYWASPDPRTPQVPAVTYMNTRTHTHMVMLNPDIVDTARGISHITADKAVEDGGPDIGASSQWVFTGNVHADTADGQLRANTATVQLTDGGIAWIKAQGTPALFQRLANNPLETASSVQPAPAAPPTPTPTSASGPRPTSASASTPTSRPTPAQSPTPTAAPTPAPAATKSSLASLTVHGHADAITYDMTADQVLFSGDSWFTDGCNDIISQQVSYNIGTQTVVASGAPVHGTIRNTHPGTASGCSTAAGGEQGGGEAGARAPRPPAPAAATVPPRTSPGGGAGAAKP